MLFLLHGASLTPVCIRFRQHRKAKAPLPAGWPPAALHIAVFPVRHCPTAARRYNSPRTRGRSSSPASSAAAASRADIGAWPPAVVPSAGHTHGALPSQGGQQRCGRILTLQAQQTACGRSSRAFGKRYAHQQLTHHHKGEQRRSRLPTHSRATVRKIVPPPAARLAALVLASAAISNRCRRKRWSGNSQPSAYILLLKLGLCKGGNADEAAQVDQKAFPPTAALPGDCRLSRPPPFIACRNLNCAAAAC